MEFETEDNEPSYRLDQVLEKIWGYTTFRAPQREIVEAVIQNRDLLAVLPTGGGKSLCFQLPALTHPGTTLILTPLIALMEDQAAQLRSQGVAAAAYHGELSRLEQKDFFQGIAEGRWTSIYLSPESLLSKKFWSQLGSLNLARMVLDEAHCLATWGSTFRPSYRRLGAVRRQLKLPVAAFTATATPQTRQTIIEVLGLKYPKVIRQNPYRPNVHLAVTQVITPLARKNQLLRFIQSHPQQPGLVYVRSQKTAELLAQWLWEQKIYCGYYHAGLSSPDRRNLEKLWLKEEVLFLICTSAFGMGINHPRVRWVVHYEAPLSTEEYLQEIGRAGRDGQTAQALLLASEPTGILDPSDQKTRAFFNQQQLSQQQIARRLIKTLPVGVTTELTDPSADLAQALGILDQLGQLTWETPFSYRISAEARPIKLPAALSSMAAYPYARQCRWQFLRASLGEEPGGLCGHCDRCT